MVEEVLEEYPETNSVEHVKEKLWKGWQILLSNDK